MEHIKFPSIEQFRGAIRRVKDVCKYNNLPLPTLEVVGTVKIHGTNAGVVVNTETNEVIYQSRTNIITPQSDNFGFATWADTERSNFIKMAKYAKEISKQEGLVQIYGEWFGPGIQKGVGVSQLKHKYFAIFSIRISENSDSQQFLSKEQVAAVVERVSSPDVRFAHVYEFDYFTTTVDFNFPEKNIDYFNRITNFIEESCPVARAIYEHETGEELPNDAKNVGEGIVWTFELLGETVRFKVKGEKHSVSKVKVLANVDVERLNSIKEFVEYAVTENRLNQGLENVPLATENVGNFIRWVVGDVLKEESDTIATNGLTTKEITSAIASKARQFFLAKAQ